MLTMVGFCPVEGQQARLVIYDVAQARHQRRRPKRQRCDHCRSPDSPEPVERAGVQCAGVGNTRTRACQSGVHHISTTPDMFAPKLPKPEPPPAPVLKKPDDGTVVVFPMPGVGGMLISGTGDDVEFAPSGVHGSPG